MVDYLGVADVFGVSPSDVMLVAAHKDDLRAAAACGLKTAYIERPLEFGAEGVARGLKDLSRSPDIDVHATDERGRSYQIEMQAYPEPAFGRRAVFGASGLVRYQAKRG